MTEFVKTRPSQGQDRSSWGDPVLRRPVRGMALVAVLWIVAALSVLVAGLSHTVRQQIQVAGLQRDQISGQALGEAVVALVLQELQAGREHPIGTETLHVPYAGLSLEVELTQLNGWVALSGVSAELLAAVLQHAGGLPSGDASALALDLALWRDTPPELDLGADPAAARQARGFEAVEDLLLVPGMDYALYERIAPLFSAELPARSRINPAAAPPEVLHVLADGNDAAVLAYMNQRAVDPGLADTSAFNPAFVATDSGSSWRLRVEVPLEQGKMLRLTQDVSLGTYARTAPWRVLRTERQIVLSAP